jgi:tetratricopeptide (TPR) repeat protein
MLDLLRHGVAILGFVALGVGQLPGQSPTPAPAAPPAGFLASYLQEARGRRDAGDLPAARLAAERALERDPNSVEALELLAEVAVRLADLDAAVHALHRWLDVDQARQRGKATPERKAIGDRLAPLDAEAATWGKLQAEYARSLADLGKEYRRKKDLLGALDVFQHLLAVAPDHPDALQALKEIRSKGGREVAVEDVYAGTDPTGGMDEAQLAAMDRAHADWEKAYTDESENYAYRTNAGFLVLKTSRIAMEQMNQFYRRFFRFMEDGGNTPKIEIRIFKSRDEYLKLGQGPPVEWSAGHFVGNAVETYAGGVSGKESVRDMYGTLFHEAAHQFVSLTCPMAPGWLNEAFASFFEGCVILSNGMVKWNRAPAGRLMPLAARMERGWMAAVDEAAAGGGTAEPERAPTFRMVVEGKYAWGPPWYAPTWGVVYFLYNFRAPDGRLVYRDALHEFYRSFRRAQPQDPAAHFEQLVLAASPLSPAKTLAELDPIWRAWILRLRDVETGAVKTGGELVAWAKAATQRGEHALAVEFLEDAHERDPADEEALWLLAGALEKDKKRGSEAAAALRKFRRALAAKDRKDDPRDAEAQKRIDRLDPLVLRYRKLKQTIAEKGLALARGYEARQLPTMALEIARRMTAAYSVPEALAYYAELAGRTGKSLARWRVAYDESSLAGWSGGDGAFQAYGKLVRATVARDGERVVTRELTADVTFDADFSLSAEIQVPEEPGKPGSFQGDLAGLCFGRKGDQRFHAVLLHPKGFLDVSSNRGGVWEVHDHRSLPVGGAWHELRIDVTGRQLDVYFDGLYVRSLEFPDPSVVRGGFGLLCGPGAAQFRNVRILGRDPFDPAARIEREVAMQRVLADPGKRTPGSFAGFAPPELAGLQFVRGPAQTLAELRGRPVMLVFWTPAQDRVIPCTAWLQSALARGLPRGLAAIVVCDGATKADELLAYLGEKDLPGASVAIDAEWRTYEDFFVKAGFFGLPRVLLIDRKGVVTFEGDPGLRRGEEWRASDGETFVDGPLDKLLGGG